MGFFSRFDAIVSGVLDRTIGDDRFRLTPMLAATPNARRAQDQDRPVIEAVGVFEYPSNEYGIELGVRKTYRESNDFRALSIGREPKISIDRKHFPDIDAEPRAGDLIEILDQPDLPMFEVVDCQRDGLSRLDVRLTHIGSQA